MLEMRFRTFIWTIYEMSSSEFTDNDTGTDKEEDTDDNMSEDDGVIGPSPQKRTLKVALFGKRILRGDWDTDSGPAKKRRKTTTKVANKTGEKTKRLNDSEKDSGTAKKRQKNTTQIANKMGQTIRRRRIRKRVQCTECGVNQRNIWRHMKDKHQKTFHSKKKDNVVVTGKGYITYICPVRKKNGRRKCGKVEKRLGDHLVRYHHIPRGSTRYTNLMAKAEPIIKREEISFSTEDDSSSSKVET
ncbi:unnamed protein product [Mytilus coruscus]|uniref:Uncharacterized protein n=1 Tax=Mytilus coruscus TaxID=42192 RepID=A0A6J8C9E1_MYTCO|nr:unnamed protein product [Mytilus coruscus]